MPKFYFTYGLDPAYPFQGGWTEIKAPNRPTACNLFQSYHPNHNRPGIVGSLNCSDIYDEDEFMRTDMLLDGNFGAWCHEKITLTRELIAGDSSKEEAISERITKQ